MNLTKDCIIEFTEAVFTGNYPRSKYSHDRKIKGKIIKESYGAKTGQHTFTIEVEICDDNSIYKGDTIRRKGRNVYPKCNIIEYPTEYKELCKEKNERGKQAKESAKDFRLMEKGIMLSRYLGW